MADQLLPADAHVGRVRLRVSDLERSLEFYRGVLGFELSRQDGAIAALATPAGADLAARELLVLEEHPGVQRRPRRPVTTGLYHVAILLPDRATLGRALTRLADAEYPLRGASDHGVSESLYLADPDGNGLELYADRARSAWPFRDGEVQMSIEPLDVDALARAGGSVPWALPAATRIGHVHLTVSSLADAERFYGDVVGLAVMQRSLQGVLALSAGGYHHHLNVNTWAGAQPSPDRPDVAGLVEWELVVREPSARRAAEHRLERAGVALERDAAAVRARDGDGNILVLVAD